MKRFAYICADPGIPVGGDKGASVHVASVCRAFVEHGLEGAIHAARASRNELVGLPVEVIPDLARVRADSSARRESRLFLANLGRGLEIEPCDFVYERYSLWHVDGLARARALGVPLTHGQLARGVAGLLMREADGIVCVSEAVAEWVRGNRRSDDGVWVVPNGVDERLFSPEGPRRAEAGSPVVVFCGSFRPWHATADLLEAFRLLEPTDLRLVCVGDGPQRESFEHQVQALGLDDRVHVTGLVPQEQVPAWLRDADVAVAPYPQLDDFYFSPLKIFEFLSLGLPVVSADVGQVPEILGHGRRGRLYRAGRPADLAQAIAALLEDRKEARRLGQAGRRWVLAQATWARRTRTILSRIESLTDRTVDRAWAVR